MPEMWLSMRKKIKQIILEVLSDKSVPMHAFEIGYVIRNQYENNNLCTQPKVIGALCGELVRDGLITKYIESNGVAYYSLIKMV